MKDCERTNLNKYNYVIVCDDYGGYVGVSDKLWSELLKSEENRNIVKRFKDMGESNCTCSQYDLIYYGCRCKSK